MENHRCVWTTEEENRALELFRAGMECAEIAEALGRVPRGVERKIARLVALDRDESMEEERPTADEIRLACEAIRASWRPEEFEERARVDERRLSFEFRLFGWRRGRWTS